MPPILQRHLPLITQRMRFSPYPNHPPQVKPKTSLRRSPSPSPDALGLDLKRKAKRHKARVVLPFSRASDNSDYEDDDDATDDDDEADAFVPKSKKGKIPKPPGEAGRPKSGGYKLEEALGWGKEDFAVIQQRAHMLMRDLDMGQCYSKQDPFRVRKIREKMEKEFPRILDYDDSWPIIDIIKTKLKSSSESARRALTAAGKLTGTKQNKGKKRAVADDDDDDEE